jgi:hypothetical protein
VRRCGLPLGYVGGSLASGALWHERCDVAGEVSLGLAHAPETEGPLGGTSLGFAAMLDVATYASIPAPNGPLASFIIALIGAQQNGGT